MSTPTDAEINAMAVVITQRHTEIATKIASRIAVIDVRDQLIDDIAVALAEEFRFGTKFAKEVLS